MRSTTSNPEGPERPVREGPQYDDNVMLMVSLTIMTAAGLPAGTVVFTASLVLGGHFMLIPRLGRKEPRSSLLGFPYLVRLPPSRVCTSCGRCGRWSGPSCVVW